MRRHSGAASPSNAFLFPPFFFLPSPSSLSAADPAGGNVQMLSGNVGLRGRGNSIRGEAAAGAKIKKSIDLNSPPPSAQKKKKKKDFAQHAGGQRPCYPLDMFSCSVVAHVVCGPTVVVLTAEIYSPPLQTLRTY